MSTSSLVTTRREPGQPERRNPLNGTQANPADYLRSQHKNLSRKERQRIQVAKNHKWARQQENATSGLHTLDLTAAPAAPTKGA